jgi:ATP adenylyltransferase
MQQLWAPWRYDYVTSVGDEKDGCFLCDAAAHPEQDQERFVLWRGEFCMCLMNMYPYSNGHLLVAPLEHVADVDGLPEDELAEHTLMLRRARRNLGRAMDPDGFNIGLNLGRAGGAGVPGHMHWHIVPRWEADTNFMTVTAGTRVIPQSLEELWSRLRELDSD